MIILAQHRIWSCRLPVRNCFEGRAADTKLKWESLAIKEKLKCKPQASSARLKVELRGAGARCGSKLHVFGIRQLSHNEDCCLRSILNCILHSKLTSNYVLGDPSNNQLPLRCEKPWGQFCLGSWLKLHLILVVFTRYALIWVAM
jgi:hypothetical protein